MQDLAGKAAAEAARLGLDDGSKSDLYFYLVEQVSTSGTIAAKDVTFIGVSTGVVTIDNGSFVSY